jgi:hypothetical protein
VEAVQRQLNESTENYKLAEQELTKKQQVSVLLYEILILRFAVVLCDELRST